MDKFVGNLRINILTCLNISYELYKFLTRLSLVFCYYTKKLYKELCNTKFTDKEICNTKMNLNSIIAFD